MFTGLKKHQSVKPYSDLTENASNSELNSVLYLLSCYSKDIPPEILCSVNCIRSLASISHDLNPSWNETSSGQRIQVMEGVRRKLNTNYKPRILIPINHIKNKLKSMNVMENLPMYFFTVPFILISIMYYNPSNKRTVRTLIAKWAHVIWLLCFVI